MTGGDHCVKISGPNFGIYGVLKRDTRVSLEVQTLYWKTPLKSLLSLSRGGLENGKKINFLFLKLGANNHFVKDKALTFSANRK